MEGKYSDLELEFIAGSLATHGTYLKDLLQEAINAKKLIKDGSLLSGINFGVQKYGQDPALTFSFASYGRFIEIRYHKKSLNSMLWKQSHAEAKAAIWGRRQPKVRSRKKKDTRWYAKTVYGSINELIGHIMYDMSSQELSRLKNIIETKNTGT